MANVVMRNRVTSEYRKVEKDGDEFWQLRAELHTDGRPRWEQTGEHDLAAFATRIATGQLRAEDIGDQDQPVEQVVEVGMPSVAGLDRGWPTPGEIEQNAGRAADMSEEELAQAARAVGIGPGVIEGYPAGHPPMVDPEEADEAGVTVGGGGLTSGVSGGAAAPQDKAERVVEAQGDAVESQPTPADDQQSEGGEDTGGGSQPSSPPEPVTSAPDAGTQATGSTSEAPQDEEPTEITPETPVEDESSEEKSQPDEPAPSGQDYSSWTASQLKAEVVQRNASRPPEDQITVVGTGSEGYVRKSDLVQALTQDDQRPASA